MGFRRVTNIAMVAVVAVFLLGVFEYAIASKALPSVIEKVNTSHLESRTYSKVSELRSSSFFSGNFQTTAEQYFSDRIPNRDSVLEANAGLQRKSIEVANGAFGFEAIPTYFGSSQAYCADAGVVFDIPTRSANPSNYAKRTDNVIAPLVARNPKINWTFFLADRNNITLASPVRTLTSDLPAYPDFAAAIQEALPERCAFIDIQHSDIDEYKQEYFKTDHHMQMQGSVRLYETFLTHVGRPAPDFGGYYIAFDGRFLGSNARVGIIDEASDVIYDVSYDPSPLIVRFDGEAQTLANLDKSYSDAGNLKEGLDKYLNVHDYWFHSNYGIIEIENPRLDESTGSLLLISDSFDNNAARLYAESFRHVFEIDPRYLSDTTIQEFIDEHDIDYAMFVMCLETIANKKMDTTFQ